MISQFLKSAACALLPCFLYATPTAAMKDVAVEPGQSLNEALAAVEGPVRAILPVGVTEHTAPLTREATLIIKGQGREASTLRAAADVPLIQQGDLMKPFDGDLILSGFTYDRAHRTLGDYPRGTPPMDMAVIRSNAGGRVVFKDFKVMHFNLDGQTSAFFRGVGPTAHRTEMDSPRHEYVGFHNFEIDYKAGGGIRNRPNNRAGFPTLQFNADRFIFDEDSKFQGHLVQHADPAQTVGEPPKGRGNAGGLGALSFNVWDYALVDGEFREVDYAIIRHCGVFGKDGLLEIRCFAPDSGYADQFWPHAKGEGKNGHLLYDGVVLTSAKGNPWQDRGFKGHRNWKTMTVRNCIINGRDAPIDFSAKNSGQQGLVTIADTIIYSARTGVMIGNKDTELEGVHIDNLTVRPDPESVEGDFFREAVLLVEKTDGTPAFHQISNVYADGYMDEIIVSRLNPESILQVSDIGGRRAERESLVEDADPLGTVPRRSMTVDGIPSEANEMEPIATVEDFNNLEGFPRLDVYMTHATEGVYLLVIVGTESLGNDSELLRKTWHGDALQFAITHGQPGEQSGYVLFDLALHDERGKHVFRRNFWSNQDLRTGLLDLEETGIELEVAFDPEEEIAVYEVYFPWEEIGLPAPWYDSFSIDLVATKGETYPQIGGTIWPSPYESLKEEKRAQTGGIFHAPLVPGSAFKWFMAE